MVKADTRAGSALAGVTCATYPEHHRVAVRKEILLSRI